MILLPNVFRCCGALFFLSLFLPCFCMLFICRFGISLFPHITFIYLLEYNDFIDGDFLANARFEMNILHYCTPKVGRRQQFYLVWRKLLQSSKQSSVFLYSKGFATFDLILSLVGISNQWVVTSVFSFQNKNPRCHLTTSTWMASLFKKNHIKI
jgi:hypothetical protein